MSAETNLTVRALWRLAVGQPHLLAAHAINYAVLLRDEGRLSVKLMQQRVALLAMALLGATTAATLTGVALMLWATAAPAALHSPLVLVVVPIVPWLLAAWAWSAARQLGPIPLWAAWQSQVAADGELLRDFAAR